MPFRKSMTSQATLRPHKLGEVMLGLVLVAAPVGACGPVVARTPPAVARVSALDSQLAALDARARPGVLGAYVEDLSTGETWGVRVDEPRPMMSVFKALMAACVLDRVDRGDLSLDETLIIRRADLRPRASVVTERFTGEAMTYRLGDLLALAVSQSDNTATDALLARLGGPAVVTDFIRSKGVVGFRLDRNELQLGQAVDELGAQRFMRDERDTITPRAAGIFLRKLAAGELVSPASTRILLEMMERTTTGPRRIRAGVPEGSVVAHKTGGSGIVEGVAIATNDIALVTLPDGRKLAIAVLLSGSRASEADRDALIADVSRAATAPYSSSGTP